MNRFLFLISFTFLLSCQRGKQSDYTPYLNHNDSVKYVGKEQCRMCHVEIYDSFIKTGMGKSINYATREHSVLDGTLMPIIHDSIGNFSYQPFFKNDSLYIREFRVRNEDTVHLLTKKVDFKIGSGNHTNSHIFEINGYLHQIPYTYYTQEELADLPPGFESGNNSRFSREIGLECISCHNAKTVHVSSSSNRYTSIPQGIDCERCHGPGEVHVKRMLAGEIIDTSKYIDYSIVNPSKLPIDLQFDICQRCHLQGTSILADGKSFESYRPGLKLNDIMDTYLPRFEDDHSFIMASHVDRLKQSECFNNSEMTCTSCHNPHKSVSEVEEKYFDNKCMQCHDLCEDNKTHNCSSCHMPKSSSTDIMHVSITDHKIGFHNYTKSKKGKFLGLVSINNPNSSNISKAKAYLKRFESFEALDIYLDSAKYYLQKSEKNFTSFIQYFYLKRDDVSLINFVISSIINEEIYSKSDLALAYSRMGEVFERNKLSDDASIFHARSVELMSSVINYRIKYGSFLFKLNQLDNAEKQFMQALNLNPTIKEVHANLGLIAILKGDFNIANIYLNQAIAIDPDYILAYENLVFLYEKKDDISAVELYLRKILEISPNHEARKILKNYN